MKLSDNTINPISSQKDQTYVSGLTDSDERPSNDDQTKSHSAGDKQPQFSGGQQTSKKYRESSNSRHPKSSQYEDSSRRTKKSKSSKYTDSSYPVSES